MSNKRRKNRGAKKVRRNLLIRLRRGAQKRGWPTPGQSKVYGANLDAAYAAHGERLREEVALLTNPYFGG